MCLITDIKEKFIAEQDMIVYKRLNKYVGQYFSPLFENIFEYELGKLYETVIRESDDFTAADNTACIYIEKTLGEDWHKKVRFSKDFISIGQGFHSFDSIARAKKPSFGNCTVSCTIPAGSEYYKDATGCIVSNQIIINGKI